MDDKYSLETMMRNYSKYIETVNYEKNEFEKNAYIDIGKTPHENINVDILPKKIREKTDYILIFMTLILTLDDVNEKLMQSYEYWDYLIRDSEETMIYNTFYHCKMGSNSGLIIHTLKHFIDMMILFVSINIFKYEKTEKIDSIGRYLGQDKIKCFDNHKPFFKILNEMDNAYKHHFSNISANNFIGEKELCFFAVSEGRNGVNKLNPQLISISARRLVEDFNNFYIDLFNVIDDLLVL